MQMTLRWFGDKFDSVKLWQIRQIPGVTGVITTLYDIPAGDVWPIERIKALQKEVEDAGLEIAGIESVNIHDAIKIGNSEREKYIENYDKELISMRENYERERAKAEEEAGKLFEELFTTNSESRANKIDRQLSDLDAKITALQRELSALEELDMRYFDDEIVALAQRDTADDGKAAWEAVDWLIEHFGYSPRISIEYSGVLGPFRSYLRGDELESRVIDLGRIIEDDEESYDMTVSNVRFADGTPVSSLDAVAIDNPWNAAFQADATAEVWYSYNGFAPAEPQTVEIAIDEPFVPTVPEVRRTFLRAWRRHNRCPASR